MEQCHGISVSQKLVNANTSTVYLKVFIDLSQYNENLEEGLYCKVGYKYNNEDDNKGVTEKIEESEQEKVTLKQGQICLVKIVSGDDDNVCDDDSRWPPLSFFINNENSLVSSGSDNISINDVCSRCENQYKYNSVSLNCSRCNGETEVRDPYNQYKICWSICDNRK